MHSSPAAGYNPSPMTTQRAGRTRGHASLAPKHLGEAASGATVAVIVGGIALAITGIGMLALALTLGSRYGGNPPPNLGSLVVAQAIGGVLLILLGGGLGVGGIGVLAGSPRARLVTGWLSAVAAVAAAAGTFLVATATPGSAVIAIALVLATLAFAASAILLLRPTR